MTQPTLPPNEIQQYSSVLFKKPTGILPSSTGDRKVTLIIKTKHNFVAQKLVNSFRFFASLFLKRPCTTTDTIQPTNQKASTVNQAIKRLWTDLMYEQAKVVEYKDSSPTISPTFIRFDEAEKIKRAQQKESIDLPMQFFDTIKTQFSFEDIEPLVAFLESTTPPFSFPSVVLTLDSVKKYFSQNNNEAKKFYEALKGRFEDSLFPEDFLKLVKKLVN
jgi:hypothetical protein